MSILKGETLRPTCIKRAVTLDCAEKLSDKKTTIFASIKLKPTIHIFILFYKLFISALPCFFKLM